MKCRLERRLVAVLITGMLGSSAAIAAEEKNDHEVEFAARLIHFDVDFRGSTSNGTEGARTAPPSARRNRPALADFHNFFPHGLCREWRGAAAERPTGPI